MYDRMRRTIKRWTAAAVALVLSASSLPVTVLAEEEPDRRITHGTATEWITEDMLSCEPPADYVVNEATQGEAKDGAYAAYFLEDGIQTVRITIDENNLNYMLQNAQDEPTVMAESVTIGDVTLGYCGFKTKGSFTLEHSATDNAGSDRFSFTVNFGKYIKEKDYGQKQNFFGCNKISFNNFFFDKTMMKEFFALKLMDEMGLPTPEYGIAKLYINGNYYGVYAMIEAMDHSILERFYGTSKENLSSYLCKPEGTTFDYATLMDDPSPLWEGDEDTKKDVEDMLPTVTEWVRKLNWLHNGVDFEGTPVDVNGADYIALLEQIMDVEEVVKYFAVHSWLCQMDNMFDGQKNFGLYITPEGKAVLVPWDYDLSFGCFYPSTAEATANYDIDVMYRLIPELGTNEKTNEEISREVYAGFPLFNVIYQSEILMEQYHRYMMECSKVVLLGGTVESTGKTYDPGYFYSYIDRMQEELVAAAKEKLADNVYYMNRIRQPKGVTQGLPNLGKILAMRAVGVLHQVEGTNALVSGFGCDLETLGNAVRGGYSSKGTLTAVDAATGIHATATYAGGKNVKAPMLTVTKIEKEDAVYSEIKSATGCDGDDLLLIYHVKNTVEPTSSYQLTVPLPQSILAAEGELNLWVYQGGTVTTGEWTVEENRYTKEVDSMEYVVITKKTKTDSSVTGEQEEKVILTNQSEKSLHISPVILAFSAVVVVLLILALVFSKKDKKK